jgi:hypothetical protein
MPERVLPLRAVQRQKTVQRVAMCRGGRGPVLLDRIPGVGQAFLVRVAILRDDGGHALRMGHRQAEASRRAVVEDVERIAVEAQRLCKRVDCYRPIR